MILSMDMASVPSNPVQSIAVCTRFSGNEESVFKGEGLGGEVVAAKRA